MDGKAVDFPIRNLALPAGRTPALPRFRQEARGYAPRWRAAVIPLALIVLALTLSLPRLTTPAVYVFDELYYAYTAGKYVAGEEAYSTEIRHARTRPSSGPIHRWPSC